MPGCARREAPMTEEVEFVRGNDRISQLARRPDIADGVTHVRAQMAEADWHWLSSRPGLALIAQAETDRHHDNACAHDRDTRGFRARPAP